MWELLDIAYVIPAATFLGFAISKYFLNGQHQSIAVLIGAGCGFVLFIYKIKNYVDKVNGTPPSDTKTKS